MNKISLNRFNGPKVGNMTNGVYVPPGNPGDSRVIPFETELTSPLCPGGVKPDFKVDQQTNASLKTAKLACEYWSATCSGTVESFLLPLLGRSPGWIGGILAFISFACCWLFSIGTLVGVPVSAFIWGFMSIYPPSFLTQFLITYFVLFFILSLTPLTKNLPNWMSVPAYWLTRKELLAILHSKCFTPKVPKYCPPIASFTGPSAGLAFFCTFVEAVTTATSSKLPWQRALIANMRTWVISVAFDMKDPDNVVKFMQLGNATEFPHKIAAIWRYNQLNHDNNNRLNLAVFYLQDQSNVELAWKAASINEEKLTPKENGPGWRKLWSEQAKLTFLFCDDLKGFIHSLHPWRWRWLIIRLCMAMSIFLWPIANLIDPTLMNPTSPTFTIECVPSCVPSSESYYVRVESGSTVIIHLKITSHGFPGSLSLDVTSTADKTILLGRKGEAIQQLSFIANQDSLLFFFTMPENPPSGGIVVGVTGLNKAHKQTQRIILFESQ